MKNVFVSLHNRIVNFHKDDKISYEKKNFYLTMTCSAPIMFLIALLLAVDGTNPNMVMYCIFVGLYVVCTTIAAMISNEELFFAYLFCFLMNFIFTPALFFMSQGIYWGMVLFFILGIIMTEVLLGRQKYVVVITICEFLYYVSLIVYSYFNTSKVYLNESNLSQRGAIAIAFSFVVAAVIFLFLYQNFMHNEMRQKVAKDNESIMKAENTKGRFLANMTHEIRTPMNAIVGMTDLILKENLSKNAREQADTIKSASTQLLQIINNILEFSKLDSGRAELIDNEYSFKKLIEEIINNVAGIYAKEEINFYVDLIKDIPDKLFGDEVRIKQVLRYLLLSPLSRSANGSVSFHINYIYDEDNRVIELKFRIASTGGGLTQDEIVAIYNAYSNYDSRQKTDYNRTGLEISICKKILNMMGGDILIDSIEGIGNAVEFSFKNYVVDDSPIIEYTETDNMYTLYYIADKRDEGIVRSFVEQFGLTATYVKSPLGFRSALEKRSYDNIYVPDSAYEELKEYIKAFECSDKVYVITTLDHCVGDFDDCKILRRPVYLFNFLETINGKYNKDAYTSAEVIEDIKYPYARVLCVDDSIVNLKVLENLLKEYGIIPKTCKSGKEALEILEKDEFDLLFIDQKMPEMDGIELISRIKKLSNANCLAKAVCATADFGNDIRDQLLSLGFSDYLAKPINKIYLEKTLKEYLPKELRVVTKIEKKAEKPKETASTEAKIETDPLEFKPETGLANLGGDKDAYLTVLLAYYEEGVQKLIDVPKQFADGDISLYTTNVHALKSSSATVGCTGISPLFKALEFAGKDNNTEYIKENSAKAFEFLSQVLEKVRDYLLAEGALSATTDDEVDEREVVEIDKSLLEELSGCITTMNLRRSEEIIETLLENNYGTEINTKVKAIKNCCDNFEYMEIKKIIEEIV